MDRGNVVWDGIFPTVATHFLYLSFQPSNKVSHLHKLHFWGRGAPSYPRMPHLHYAFVGYEEEAMSNRKAFLSLD